MSQEYLRVPRNVVYKVLGTMNSNIVSASVEHFEAKSYSLPIMRNLNPTTLRYGAEAQYGEARRFKLLAECVVPGYIFKKR